MLKRRHFIQATTMATAAWAMPSWGTAAGIRTVNNGKRIGIIGLDTSHSIEFTKWFNRTGADHETGGYKVICAFPQGSRDIKESVSRIEPYTTEIKKYGVTIVGSISELLDQVDVVCLETNDGRIHLEQALPVFEAGKPVFIDKPIAASLEDTLRIFEAADKFKVPVFSSSSLRYTTNTIKASSGEFGKVLGADTYSPAKMEASHPDLFWYGIHGVEMLFAVMGKGCKEVRRIYTKGTDIVTGVWEDGRLGSFRGTRSGKADFGGTAFCEKSNVPLGPFTGYQPLLLKIVEFFQTGKSPVSAEETSEIIAFMEAADWSKKRGGKAVQLSAVFKKAR